MASIAHTGRQRHRPRARAGRTPSIALAGTGAPGYGTQVEIVTPELAFIPLRGAELEPFRAELGDLRISVFREFPYLYDGDADYERSYLRVYANSPRSLVVLVRHQSRLVGATTCIPMSDETPEFQQPFLDAGRQVDHILYFGESIVLPEFRGTGIGHRFFQLREQHAHDLGNITLMAFCAIDRPPDHPRRPHGYRTLHAFWNRMGFQRQDTLQCQLSWKEIDEAEATQKTLTFWTKSCLTTHQ